DPSAIARNTSILPLLISLLFRTISDTSKCQWNQLVHASLIYHLVIQSVSHRISNWLILLSISFLSLFFSLSVPLITDHLTSGRIYVTPPNRRVEHHTNSDKFVVCRFHFMSFFRFISSLLSPSSDTLVLLSPLLLLLFLSSLLLGTPRGSQIGVILSPFGWLLLSLLRMGETCDEMRMNLLSGAILAITITHLTLTLK
ncbi:hypothetical protein PFISCL1PPCAC_27602, partial [Pristionchus fissidentatus]